jgi:hypothetical protein
MCPKHNIKTLFLHCSVRIDVCACLNSYRTGANCGTVLSVSALDNNFPPLTLTLVLPTSMEATSMQNGFV